MLPSTYKFFEEVCDSGLFLRLTPGQKTDEVKELKEDKHLAKLLERDRIQEPWEHHLIKVLPLHRPWGLQEVKTNLHLLREYCRADMLEQRQLAAV